MGSDNLQNLHKWKNYEEILESHKIYVYPRPGVEIKQTYKNVCFIKEVPQMNISAAFIRQAIKKKKDVSYLIPERAWQYIDEMNFYKQ
mgnify:CR=1 FL=1